MDEFSNKILLLLSDLNMSKVDWGTMTTSSRSHRTPDQIFLGMCDRHNFRQFNEHPSRSQSNNILDVVISNSNTQVSNVTTEAYIADCYHFPFRIFLDLSQEETAVPSYKPLNYRRTTQQIGMIIIHFWLISHGWQVWHS